jgi:hypothetical protein
MDLFSEPLFLLLALSAVPALVISVLDRLQNHVPDDGWFVCAVICAVFALLLWAIPSGCYYYFPLEISCSPFFELSRIPALTSFFMLSLILLLVRAGNRR